MARDQNGGGAEDEFEPEFLGVDGGDRFFGKPDTEPSGPGSVLAAYEVPAESVGDDDTEPVHFECVGYDWAQNVRCCLDHDLLEDTSDSAGLAVLELERTPSWVTPGGAPGTIDWYQIDYEPSNVRDADGRIYTNLFSDGTPVRVKGRPADSALISRLIPGYFGHSLQSQAGTVPDVFESFPNVGQQSAGVAIYDVGQGAWQGSLSGILCARHSMMTRRMYAKQEDDEGGSGRRGGVAVDPKELIDQFVKGPMSAEAVQAASMAFKKALIERALGAELSHHLGYPRVRRRPRRRATTATAPVARPC